MEQLNEYGNLSGGFIFDEMDRFAHSHAKKYLGDCVTANATINYFSPVSPTKEKEYCMTLKGYEVIGNKICCNIAYEKLTGFEPLVLATFLFIKRK